MNKLFIFAFLCFFTFCVINIVLSKPTRFSLDALLQRFNESDCNITWDHFKRQHKKLYITKDETTRKKRFKDRQKIIKDHNDLFKKGNIDYFTVVNEFSDMVHYFIFSFFYNYH